MDGFAHLHVASGFSMRYGASMPEDLVERATAHGQEAVALTDRDGLYGAIRFATACGRAGIAPVLGVDLAVEALGQDGNAVPRRARTPVRGGAGRKPRPDRTHHFLPLGSGPSPDCCQSPRRAGTIAPTRVDRPADG